METEIRKPNFQSLKKKVIDLNRNKKLVYKKKIQQYMFVIFQVISLDFIFLKKKRKIFL